MADFEYIAGVTGYVGTTGATQVSASGALNVTAGDLLVAWGEWQNAGSTDTIVFDENDGTDAFVTGTETINSDDLAGCFGWLIDAPGDASFTPRMTVSAAARRLTIVVMQFRPVGAGTVAMDAETTDVGSSTSLASGVLASKANALTLGGGCAADGGTAFSNEKIGGIAATTVIRDANNYSAEWYRLLTDAEGNIGATATNANDLWVCGVIQFTYTAGGEGGGSWAGGGNLNKLSGAYNRHIGISRSKGGVL